MTSIPSGVGSATTTAVLYVPISRLTIREFSLCMGVPLEWPGEVSLTLAVLVSVRPDHNLVGKPGVEQGCGPVERPSLQCDSYLGDFLRRRFPAQPDAYSAAREKQSVSLVLVPTDFRKRLLP